MSPFETETASKLPNSKFDQGYKKIVDEFKSIGYETKDFQSIYYKSRPFSFDNGDQKLKLKGIQVQMELKKEKKQQNFTQKLRETKLNFLSIGEFTQKNSNFGDYYINIESNLKKKTFFEKIG